MAKDWKQLARVVAPDIPEDALDRLSLSLDTLDAPFRPQVDRIPLLTEPATVMLIARDKDA